jgi:hypothetical protein
MRLSIAKDYSRTPGARLESEGPFSGARFRREYLAPRLKHAMEWGELLIVDLDGTAGLSASFLDEAFGGLTRLCLFNYRNLHSHLRLESTEEPELVSDTWSYIYAPRP